MILGGKGPHILVGAPLRTAPHVIVHDDVHSFVE